MVGRRRRGLQRRRADLGADADADAADSNADAAGADAVSGAAGEADAVADEAACAAADGPSFSPKRTKDSPELYFNAGEAAFRLAQVEGKNSVSLRQEAIADFVAGLKLFPYDSRLALKLAMAQAAAGNYFPALEATMYAKKIDPNSSFVPAYRGMVEYAFYYYDDAESAFRDAILLG